MTPASEKPRAFDQGLIATTTLGATALVAFYALATYETDIRARIPFLLNLLDLRMLLLLLTVFGALGIAGTMLLRVSPVAAWRGIALGSVACVMLLASGSLGQLIPPDYKGPRLYGVIVVAVLVAGTVLWRARVRAKD